MKFIDARKEMEKGKKIKKDGWLPDEFLYIYDGRIVDELGEDFYVNPDDVGEWKIYNERKEVNEELKTIFQLLKEIWNSEEYDDYKEFITTHNEKEMLLDFYSQLIRMSYFYKLD